MTCFYCQNTKQSAKTNVDSGTTPPRVVLGGSTSNTPSFPSPSLLEIQDEVHKLSRQTWNSNLPFPGHCCSPNEPLPSYLGDYNPFKVVVDLSAYTSPVYSGMIIRFDPQEFPVSPGDHSQNYKSMEKLKQSLSNVCRQEGKFELVSNGCQRKLHRMRCNRFRWYQAGKKALAPGEVRQHTINRNKNNQRSGSFAKEALSFKKGTYSSRPEKTNDECCCGCHFNLSFDDLSLFFCCGYGNFSHHGHPKLNPQYRPVQFRNLPERVKVLCYGCAQAGIGPTATARLVDNMHGISISARRVYRNTFYHKLAIDVLGEDQVRDEDSEVSDIDRVINYLQKTKQIYTALFHRRENAQDLLWNEFAMEGSDPHVSVVENTGAGQVNEDVMQYASSTREAVNAHNDQDVLVALVWMSVTQSQIFTAFPEQLSIDGTHKTQRENWELITMAVLDQAGNPEVVIKCWAPNHRKWLYKWLFENAIPALVGRSACMGVRLIITDGDSNECDQLDMALQTTFTNAKRRRCGWHIVERGWTRLLPANLGVARSKKNFKEVLQMIRRIKTWLYTMMKEIENEDEYNM